MSDMTYQRPVSTRPLATLGEIANQHMESGRPASIALARRINLIDRILDRARGKIDDLLDETVVAIEARPFSAAMIAFGIGIIGGGAIRVALRRRPFSRG
jgi:hypothetical protein